MRWLGSFERDGTSDPLSQTLWSFHRCSDQLPHDYESLSAISTRQRAVVPGTIVTGVADIPGRRVLRSEGTNRLVVPPYTDCLPCVSRFFPAALLLIPGNRYVKTSPQWVFRHFNIIWKLLPTNQPIRSFDWLPKVIKVTVT